MADDVFTYFVLVRATPAWLSGLTREQRAAFFETEIGPILARYPAVRLRYFDAEAHTAFCSDVMMLETTDQRAYRLLFDELRDSPLFGRPYFDVVQIIPCIEDGYRELDEARAA